jgi:protein SCO1/2
VSAARATVLAWLAALLQLAQAGVAAAPAPALPGDSVLNIAGRFTGQDGRSFTLRQRRGGPQLIAMFYSSCQLVCPMLIETGMAADRALSADERSRLRVLLVSLDPDRDSVAALRQAAQAHRIDTRRWTLARTDALTVRRLAAALDVRYRQLVNGEYNHTSALLLLDGEGRILARTDRLGADPEPQFLTAMRAALAAR